MKNKKLNTLIQTGKIEMTAVKTLGKYDYANLFDVVNKGEKSYFNLCKNIYFDNTQYLTSSDVETYIIVDDDSWSSISYRFYRTYKLWWLICKFNNVRNPFEELTVGKLLKIPSEELVDIILETINKN